MLEIRDLVTGYGSATVLHGVCIEVKGGEVVGLFGRNGAGKSTTLGAAMGVPRPWAGVITFNGRRIDDRRTDAIVASGIALVPQQGGIFQQQTIHDALELSASRANFKGRERNRRREEIYARFPRLLERRSQLGGTLSGGERRMLAIAMALVRQPRVLLLDEPSIGLAPMIVAEVAEVIQEVRDSGVGVLVAEQNIGWLLPLLSSACVLDSGTVVASGSPESLGSAANITEIYLGSHVSD